MEYEEIKLNISKGDRIKSKQGILMVKSPLSGKDYLVFDMEYLGKGIWKIHGDKQEVNSKLTSTK